MMRILDNLPLQIGVKEVLSAQGIDPERAQSKNKKLIELLENAITFGKPYLDPQVVYARYKVINMTNDRLDLDEGNCLEGELISKLLGKADEVFVAVCTIGNRIENFISKSFDDNPGVAVSMDGYASAAVEVLAGSFCNYVEEIANKSNAQTSIAINPGLIGWPVEIGQPQIFSLVEAEKIGVTLSPNALMQPIKSLSLVIGIGKNLNHHHKICDFCGLKNTCTHRQKHPKELIHADA